MRLRVATPADLDLVLPRLTEFHVHERLATTPESRRTAVEQLLREPQRGRIVLAEEANAGLVGYGVLVFGYSIEFGGIDAFVDELFVVPGRRGRGIGTRLLSELETEAVGGGSRCLHLEVDVDNPRALELYKRQGYVAHRRRLMTKALS